MSDTTNRKIALARKLRKAMTEPERLLWSRLKSRNDGLVFKRQQAIGPYILDFFCHKAQLAIEVDGGLHGTESAYARDNTRDAYFLTLGIETYRISAAEVYRNADAAADGIRLRASDRYKKPA
jgi:very-short-patch-repair endonuclease